jgi:hypothetical protein
MPRKFNEASLNDVHAKAPSIPEAAKVSAYLFLLINRSNCKKLIECLPTNTAPSFVSTGLPDVVQTNSQTGLPVQNHT